MNYQIIKNEKALREFIAWLPECAPNEKYYYSLFARKKLLPDHPALAYDKTQIRRGLARKEDFFRKIQQLECPVGAYTGKDDIPIPQESLVFYVSVNPRDLNLSILRGAKALIEAAEKGLNINPAQEMFSVIQQTKSETRFHVFDLDNKSQEVLRDALEIVNNEAEVVETRGGYHILVPQKVAESGALDKNWYQKLKQITDVSGDALTPMPGTTQGSFVPILLDKPIFRV